MSFLPKLLKATQSSQTNDRTPYTSNVTTAPTHGHSLPGRDFVKLNEPGSSITETLGKAETSEVATPSANYSKRASGRFGFSP
jgi:hypothetical protein